MFFKKKENKYEKLGKLFFDYHEQFGYEIIDIEKFAKIVNEKANECYGNLLLGCQAIKYQK